jgi:hypothetical protein
VLFHLQIFMLGFLPLVAALYYAAAASQRWREIVLIARPAGLGVS